ncbi:hypothetical protein SESBI_41293 [Sesbania bispinosa]|nr:hypothetical protein SESBI_41293 [Sesbania bispinosa]
MVYSYYTPTYYSTLHDSITSLCKTILPFSFKKRSLPAAEHRLSKLQSDNLKWQQDSFHQVLNLMGLHKEGIVAETEVSAFRTHLLDTLIASPPEQEHPVILRDKLLFLQELLYAKCISEEDYHSSKRPLLQRLAVQGAQIEARDVIVAKAKDPKENSEEEWSVIDLKDEKCLMNKENLNSKSKSNQGSALKQIKGAASVFGFVSSHKHGKNGTEKSIFDSPSSLSTKNELGLSKENPFWDTQSNGKQSEGGSILMEASGPPEPMKESTGKSIKKQWGFDGFKKWKRNDSDDETTPLPSARALGEGPDTKLIKKKLHSDGAPSDFFIDKVLGDKIKKELTRIQTELSSTNPNLKFSSWCDRYGDVVLDVVKKEFKSHVGEMEKMRNFAREKHGNSRRWTTFEDDENFHPNLLLMVMIIQFAAVTSIHFLMVTLRVSGTKVLLLN